jgi:hypothetical protein
MSEEPGALRGGEDQSGGTSPDRPGQSDETYYSLERDSVLRVDRRKAKRPQTYWVGADHMEPQFADHIQVIKVDQYYHLTFGQSRVPVARQENEPTAVTEIQPVARLILPAEVIRRLEGMLHKDDSRGSG